MTSTKPFIFITLILTVLTLISCTETKTSNAKKAYKSWTGTNPPADIELLNGQYWQSAHWTKEYIMYLKFKPTNKWWNDFLKQNSLSPEKGNWTISNDAPSWFKPSKNSVKYGSGDDFDQGSKYFRDTITGICYIYEIQL